ncbi:MAG TPA: glutathione S-transferase family protein [Stellaceae bacterium]|nr:glutathione S-transferase family protein [Stellaceae bacterium]
MAEFIIHIGNKNYSSWSLRAWLALKTLGVPFEEVVVPLYENASRAEILRHSPSGKLPVLRHRETIVWDSLAIAEYLAERFPEARLWPEGATARATARAISQEMHAGFTALREHLPMNMRASVSGRAPTPEAQADLNRITALWRDCRKRYGADGPFLFGHFTIADAMYAPVVSRLRTYKVDIGEEEQAYADAVWAYPPLAEWAVAARNEPMIVEKFEV